MKQKLQQAIIAARSGQTTEAQILLTQAIQDDPNDANSWFLLSTLVDSDQKKTAYLSKVLTLDANHVKAKEQLARLTDSEEPDIALRGDTAVYTSEPSLPEPEKELAWTSEEDSQAEFVVTQEDETPTASFTPETVTDTVTEEIKPTPIKTSVAKTTPTAPATKDNKSAQEIAQLNRILRILGILAFIVLIALLVVIF